MMTDQTPRFRRHGVIAISLATLFIAACSGSSTGTDGDSATPTTATQSGTETTSPATTTLVEAAPRPDPAIALASEIDALGASYEFESEITTPAGDAVAVSGLRNGDASQFRMIVGGAALDVITIAQDVWLREDGSDEWLASAESPTGDPLEALAAPLDLRWVEGAAQSLDATYSATSLGLNTDENIDVQITLEGSGIRFESATGATSLVTTLHPSTTPAEISRPTN